MNRFTTTFTHILTVCTLAICLAITACGGGTSTDNTNPTVSISSSDTPPAGMVTFTFVFSEPVAGFKSENVRVTGGNQSPTVTQISPTIYTLTVTPTTGTISATVNVGQFSDLAGNPNLVLATCIHSTSMSTSTNTSTSTIISTSTTTSTITNTSTIGILQPPYLKSISGTMTGDGTSVLFTFVFSEDVGTSFTRDDVNITCGKTSTMPSEGIVNVGCGNKDAWTQMDATHYTLAVSGVTDSDVMMVTATVDVGTFASLTGYLNWEKKSGTVSIHATGPKFISAARTGYVASTGKMELTLTFDDPIVDFNYDKIHVDVIEGPPMAFGAVASSDLTKISDNVWKLSTRALFMGVTVMSTPVIVRMDIGAFRNAAGSWNMIPSEYIIDTTDTVAPPSVSNIWLTNTLFGDVTYYLWFNKLIQSDANLLLNGLDIVGGAMAKPEVKFGAMGSTSVALTVVPYPTSHQVTITLKEGSFKDVYGNANKDRLSIVYKMLPFASGYQGTSPNRTFTKNDIASNTVNVQSMEGGSFSASMDGVLSRGLTDVWWPDIPGEGPGAVFTSDNNFISPTVSWGYGLSPSAKPASMNGTIGAPGNNTVDISEYSEIGIELGTNLELTRIPNIFRVILIGPTVNGCATELNHDVHVYSVPVSWHRLLLKNFNLAKSCSSYDTAQKALSAGVAKIKYLLPGDQMQYSDPVGATQFSNGLALGKIIFYGASSTGIPVNMPSP